MTNRTDMSTTKQLVVTAMLIALCVLLPMAFHSIPRAGSILMPMHIPVLLAGLICGWKFGLVAGLAGPLLSSTITGMPPAGIVPIMMIELGTYGLVAGILMHFVRTKRASFDLYVSLISAMLIGRVIAGIAQFTFFFGGSLFGRRLIERGPEYGEYVYNAYGYAGWVPEMVYSFYPIGMWVTSYFVTSLPGLVIQLAFIPAVVMALERERLIPLRYPIEA